MSDGLWECPDCALRMDAGHVDADSDKHSCPDCGETRLRTALAEREKELAEAVGLLKQLLPMAKRCDHDYFGGWSRGYGGDPRSVPVLDAEAFLAKHGGGG